MHGCRLAHLGSACTAGAGPAIAGLRCAGMRRNAFVLREVTMPVLTWLHTAAGAAQSGSAYAQPALQTGLACASSPDLSSTPVTACSTQGGAPAVVQTLSDLLSRRVSSCLGSNDYFAAPEEPNELSDQLGSPRPRAPLLAGSAAAFSPNVGGST